MTSKDTSAGREALLHDLIGRTIGSYRVERMLGRGGMGAVYEAFHPYIERRAAIKVLYPELSENPQFSARFLNEARAVNLVHHPGLVQIFEFGVLPEGSAYIIMEYLQGETLGQRLERAPGHRLTESEALDIARQMAAALSAAHGKDIVHRDLKPDNVMLVPDPELPSRIRCKILDFGVAKMASRGGPETSFRTRTGVALGTPEYMSPEQCIGALDVDGKADVYALGVMLYEMLVGKLPFSAEMAFDVMAMHVRAPAPLLRQSLSGVDPRLERLVESLLAKSPLARPTMMQVAADLERLATSGPMEPLDAAAPASSEQELSSLLPTVAMDELPLRRTEASPAQGTGRLAKLAPIQAKGQVSRRVLLVDDEPDLATTLCTMLEGQGFICHVVHDGGLVMEVLRRFQPDLVVLDVELPGKSGYKLCWEIKSAPDSAALPVILLSAKGQDADHKLGMAMQADAYVDKPFHFDELVALIHMLLDRPG